MPKGKYVRPGLLERLARYGEKQGECIIWRGDLTENGYGRIQIDGRAQRVHRVVFELVYGETDLNVLHSCDNRACFRIDHLFSGTQQENIDDCITKGRFHKALGEAQHSAKLTDERVQLLRIAKRWTSLTIDDLSQVFGVTRSTVSDVVRRKTWRHVPPHLLEATVSP